MPAQMRIDQAGLPAGSPGFARTDGLDTGALVTLTSTGGGTTHRFELLWVPPDDNTAVASLAQTGPTTWTFSPTPGAMGSYRIRLVVNEGTSTESEQIRTLVVRTPNFGLIIPAANETADVSATLSNASATTIQRSDQNEPFAPFVAGSSWGWWRAWDHLARIVDGLVAGAGISELTADVLAGPGAGAQAATVVAIQGRPVSAAAPALGDALRWDGAQWLPFLIPSNVYELTTDVLAGPGTGAQAATVVRIQGFPVSAGAPVLGDVMTWNGAQWVPTAPGGGGGITELTTDVLAGPGAGAQAATVVAVQGQPWTAAAPALNDVPFWNGAAWDFAPPAGANPVGPAQCIFVDPVGGNDGTGTRGRADLPFQTLNAAFAAITTADDTVVCAPGVHTVTVALAEPPVPRISLVGYGRDVTRIEFASALGFQTLLTATATLTDRLTVRGMTIALASGDLGFVVDGQFGNGQFMSAGVVFEDLRFTPIGSHVPTGFVLSFCSRVAISDVRVDGSVQFNTCWQSPLATIPPSYVRGLQVLSNTRIAWDDDAALAFLLPMSRTAFISQDCALGNVILDGQPIWYPERCSLSGLTCANPMGASVSGVAAEVWGKEITFYSSVGGAVFIDFSGAEAFLDTDPSPTFWFTDVKWAAPTFAVFDRVAELNGRNRITWENLQNAPAGFSSFQCALGIDGAIYGASLMPSISIIATGTFTPSRWTMPLYGLLGAGPNVVNFPWGAALAAPSAVFLTPTNAGEALAVTATTAASVTVDAAVGGGFVHIDLAWTNGY